MKRLSTLLALSLAITIFAFGFAAAQLNLPDTLLASLDQTVTGSGAIVSSNGYILTNNHVIDGATTIEVVLTTGISYEAQVIETDPDQDLALIKINVSGLPSIPVDMQRVVRVGEPVVSIGSPKSLVGTVSSGTITALNRTLTSLGLSGLYQTNADIAPGSSGGPLIDEYGNIIGINVAVAVEGEDHVPITAFGFSIPISQAQHMLRHVSSAPSPRHDALSVPDIAEMCAPATVYIVCTKTASLASLVPTHIGSIALAPPSKGSPQCWLADPGSYGLINFGANLSQSEIRDFSACTKKCAPGHADCFNDCFQLLGTITDDIDNWFFPGGNLFLEYLSQSLYLPGAHPAPTYDRMALSSLLAPTPTLPGCGRWKNAGFNLENLSPLYTFADQPVQDFYARRGTTDDTMITVWLMQFEMPEEAADAASELGDIIGSSEDSRMRVYPPEDLDESHEDTEAFILHLNRLIYRDEDQPDLPQALPHPVLYGYTEGETQFGQRRRNLLSPGTGGIYRSLLVLSAFKDETVALGSLEIELRISGYVYQELRGSFDFDRAYSPSTTIYKDLSTVGLIGTAAFSIGEFVYIIAVETQERFESYSLGGYLGYVDLGTIRLTNPYATVNSDGILSIYGVNLDTYTDYYKGEADHPFDLELVPTRIPYSEFCDLLEEAINETLAGLGG